MKRGVTSGSYDVITYGHVWLIQQAVKIVDQLHVVVGINVSKKYLFTLEERVDIVNQVLAYELGSDYQKISVTTIGTQLLVNYAASINAPLIFKGIRNTEDFNYENQILLVNKKICPLVETVFLIPPSDLTEVSSSTVKGIVGFDNWESIVSKYVPPIVVDRLKQKMV